MARTKADMQRLIDQRNQLLAEIEALRNKVAGLELAISLLDGEVPSSKRSSRSVKTVLLDFLREVGVSGLSAAQAVDMANKRGLTLNSGSVSSTLSRFKNDGLAGLDGNRYVLNEFLFSGGSHEAAIRTSPGSGSREYDL